MRKASALVQRLTDVVTTAAGAAVRGMEDMLDALAPKPEVRLVPIRVRQGEAVRRR